jgi:hypothetical protein
MYFTCKIVVFIDLKPVVAMTTDNVSPLVSPGSQTKKKQKKKKKSVNEIVLEDDLNKMNKKGSKILLIYIFDLLRNLRA